MDARVFIPDFFDGSPVPIDVFTNPEARAKFDLKEFNVINSKYAREQWMRDAAKAIKSLPGVKSVGAVGVPLSFVVLADFVVLLGRKWSLSNSRYGRVDIRFMYYRSSRPTRVP